LFTERGWNKIYTDELASDIGPDQWISKNYTNVKFASKEQEKWTRGIFTGFGIAARHGWRRQNKGIFPVKSQFQY
jgi:hypothetical protein